MLTDISIDTQNFDISMGRGFVRFIPGGGIIGNVFMNGNVGIRKMNPTSALDVSGTIKTNLIDTQNFDVSMGTGFVRFAPGGGIIGNGDDIQPVHCLHTVVVKIEGDEYAQWGDDDSYIESIIQRELQKLHAETPAAE